MGAFTDKERGRGKVCHEIGDEDRLLRENYGDYNKQGLGGGRGVYEKRIVLNGSTSKCLNVRENSFIEMGGEKCKGEKRRGRGNGIFNLEDEVDSSVTQH